MTAREGALSTAGAASTMIRHAAAAAWTWFSVTVLLAAWNFIQVVLGSEAYRRDLSMALDLFFVALGGYAALVAAFLAALAGARALLSRLSGSRPASPARLWASSGASAAAFLAGYGILAARASGDLLKDSAGRIDALILIAATAASGAAAGAAVARMENSDGAANLARRFVGFFIGMPAALTLWRLSLDLAGAAAGSLTGVVAACVAVPAGIATGILLARLAGRAGRAAVGWRGGTVAAILLALVASGLPAITLTGAARAVRNASSGSAGGSPNILFITADTLRADRLGCYGSARVRTPALDALAARGVRVETFYAAASWTVPATVSMMTGLSPSSHGLMTYRDSLGEEVVHLASLFQEAGYATAGFSANPVLTESLGFGAGFDIWEEDLSSDRLHRHRGSPIRATLEGLGLWHSPETFPAAPAVSGRALEWLGKGGGQPFFLYLHFIDPHDPYAPPAPFETMYTMENGPLWRMQFGTLQAIEMGRKKVSPEDRDRLVALYDGAVSYLDSEIGRLLDELKGRGLLENTLIIFTADHGEEFNDHGGLGHEHTLYEELVRVPFIVAGAGVRTGGVIEGPARQIDVAPTIAEAAGLGFPSPVEGVSLWPALTGEAPPESPDVFMEEAYIGIRSPVHLLRAVRRGPMKAIGSTFHVDGSGPWRWELYDLAADPAEKRDLAADRPEALDDLRLRVEGWSRRARARGRSVAPPDPELERRLKALGYIQ